MTDKKELKRLYKESSRQAGVFQIKNTVNQKVFIKSSLDLNTMNGQRFQLNINAHKNKLLQEEWNQFGKDSFVIEVLEVLKQAPDDYLDPATAVKKLEKNWLDQIQPFGERGYHQAKKD